MTKLEEFLLNRGLITPELLEDAQAKQMGSKRPIQEVLIEMGFVEEKVICDALSEFLGIEVIDLDTVEIPQKVIDLIPYEHTQRYNLIPLAHRRGTITVAMSNPIDVFAIDDLRALTGCEVETLLATRGDIARAVVKHYYVDASLYDLYKHLLADEAITITASGEEKAGLVGPPVVRLVNLVLIDAFKRRATDIHFEPQKKHVLLRYNVDGQFRKIMEIPKLLYPRMLTRLKSMGGLELVVTQKPQRGRGWAKIEKKTVDLRILSLPTPLGEKVEIGVLNKSLSFLPLSKIGFRSKDLAIYRKYLRSSSGMILLAGPEHSGKTATLYASLRHLKSKTKSIATVEDSVEYPIRGITQVAVNEAEEGESYAESLRAVLRKNPRVLMVKEIRDPETARIAIEAANDGHLVLSTLVANSASDAITKLLGLVPDPQLVSASMIAIIAQRLVREVCKDCMKPYRLSEEAQDQFREYIGLRQHILHGKGCEKCNYTGYYGRMGIFEILPFTEEIRQLVRQQKSNIEIAAAARRAGMRTLEEDGSDKALEGITTLDEVTSAVTLPEEEEGAAKECRQCGKTLEEEFNICPFCGTPVMASAPSIVPPRATTEAAKPGQKTILVVDDSEFHRVVVRDVLLKEDYHVIEAASGNECLERIFRDKPDLVVLDVIMPDINGFDICRKIRSNLETASLPVIMLTVKSDVESEVEGLDAGADDYLYKPLDPKKLVARTRIIFKRK